MNRIRIAESVPVGGVEVTDHYSIWCAERGCTHGHCPEGHDKPQPFAVVLAGESDWRLICAKCWHYERAVVEIVPCTPDDC